ncbi:hypothetical protein KEM52_003610, partial [Ascosphaera acerosa]
MSSTLTTPPTTTSTAGHHEQAGSHRRRRRHLTLRPPFDMPGTSGSARCLGAAHDAQVDAALKAAIASMLIDAGFDTTDPVALDAFRNAVDEYILHLLAYVRQAMHASRRTTPIPPDFEHALAANQLSPDLLQPYTVPLSPSSRPYRRVTPPKEAEEDRAVEGEGHDDPFTTTVQTYAFLGPELSPAAAAAATAEPPAQPAYIPRHFPAFPSKHTYIATPIVTKRKVDPRWVRERATEEGRLGEEALRRL